MSRLGRWNWTAIVAILAVAVSIYSVVSVVSDAAADRELTRRSQASDRYIAAIGQLSNPTLEIRRGGMYALEQLAKEESSTYYRQTYEVLAAYIRTRAPATNCAPRPDIDTSPPTDIAAALSVLGRRSHPQTSTYRPNLTTTCLNGADLTGAHLNHADLTDADLTGANLTRADLTGADLAGADLTGANLAGANLTAAPVGTILRVSANLADADLTSADLTSANLGSANLTDANLTDAYLGYAYLAGANLAGADLKGADLKGADLTGANLGGGAVPGVRWPRGFKPPG